MEITLSPKQNDFDPVFRLFTVIYGAVVAFSLKPFAEALIKENREPKLDYYDFIFLVALVSFFVIDWMWSAAYLLNYWPKRPSEHQFYRGFCDAGNLRRGVLLVSHVSLVCSFAIFANLAWLTSWKPPSLALACPLLWLALSFLFSNIWDGSMYLFSEVNMARAKILSIFMGFLYFLAQVATTVILAFCFMFITQILKADDGTLGFYIKGIFDYFHLLNDPRVTVLFVLLAQILLRLVTYFRADELIVIEENKENNVQLQQS